MTRVSRTITIIFAMVALTSLASMTLANTSNVPISKALVSGKVVDSGGVLIKGIKVEAYNVNKGLLETFGYTDSSGGYKLKVKSGSMEMYRVRANTTGTSYASQYYNKCYIPSYASIINASTASEIKNIDFQLPLSGSISGSVFGACSQNLSEMMVYAYDYNMPDYIMGMSQVGEDGWYVISDLPPGTYRVGIETGDSECVPEFWNNSFDLYASGSVTVTAGQKTEDIDFELEIGGHVSGQVYQEDTGSPFSGVTVNAYTASGAWAGFAQSQVDGSYVILHLLPGKYWVKAENKDAYMGEYYDGSGGTYYRDKAAFIEVVPSGEVSGIGFSLSKGGKISGRVTQQASPFGPISMASVTVYDFTNSDQLGSAMTDWNGNYTVTGLRPGSCRVECQTMLGPPGASSYLKQYYNNAYIQADADAVEVLADGHVLNVDFAMAKGGTISGKVTKDGDGAGIASVSVCAGSLDSGTSPYWGTTSMDGSYSIQGLPPGSYLVRVDPWMTSLYYGEYYKNTYLSSLATPVPVTLDSTTGNIDFGLTAKAKVSGSAYNYPQGSYRASLTLNVEGPSGSLEYYYAKTGMTLTATSISSVKITGKTVEVTGYGTLNNKTGYSFSVQLTDGPDSFGIDIFKPNGSSYYSAERVAIRAGNLKITPVTSAPPPPPPIAPIVSGY